MKSQKKFVLFSIIFFILGFSVFVKIEAQSDDFILEWEQHWETFGKGGTCNYGTHNFYLGDVDNDEIDELITGGFMYYMENTSRVRVGAPLRIWNWNGKNLTCEKSHDWNGSIRSIFSGDVDNDGLSDIITGGTTYDASGSYNALTVWSYDGKSIVQKDVYKGISASSIFVSDIDNDQIIEVLVAGRNSVDNKSFAELSILKWNEDKLSLVDNVQWCASNEAYAYSVFADDLDNDGNIEVVSGGYDNDLTNSSGQLRVWTFNGEELSLVENEEWRLVENVYGVTISGLPMGNTVINNLKVGDVDSDGAKEIVTGGWAYDGEKFKAQLKIWNFKENVFSLEKSEEWISEDITEIKSISLNDVDGDGDIEIVTCGLTSVYGSFNNTESVPDHAQIRIFKWNGNSLNLEHSKDWTIGDGVVAWNIVTGDIDKDETVEIVTVGCMGESGLCDPDLRIWSINIRPDSFFFGQLELISSITIGIILAFISYFLFRKKMTNQIYKE